MSSIDPLDAFAFFNGQGLPAESAAGIVGNMAGESSFNPSALGDNGKSFGLFQMGAANQSLFASTFGFPVQKASPLQQMQYVMGQLKSPAYANTYNTLMAGGSVTDMTRAFMQGFERPSNLSSLNSRVASASNVLSSALGNGSNLLNKAGDLMRGSLGNAASIAMNTLVPGSGLIANAVGLGSGPSYIQQFRDWLATSHFWQRIGLGVLALIFIGGAIFLLGSNSKTVKAAVKAIAAA